VKIVWIVTLELERVGATIKEVDIITPKRLERGISGFLIGL